MECFIAGVDEAGYGPLLGPLCVGLTVFATPASLEGDPPAPRASCLWKLLESGVCREPGRGGKAEAGGRVAIADSKQLKLASSVTTTHPLIHLERGVLAMLASGDGATAPTNDSQLFERLAVRLPMGPWYEGSPTPLPLALGEGESSIAGNILRGSMQRAGVSLRAMRCRVLGEDEFNAVARAQGGKAATTGLALREHLHSVWQEFGALDDAGRGRLGIVCDRQGGRVQYGEYLADVFPGARVEVLEEADARSRYTVVGRGLDGRPRRAGLAFLVEGERHHLPIALASMVAKFVRELLMLRFNRAWGKVHESAVGRTIKPTAGYALDARRWLREMRQVLSNEEREQLVRVV